MNGALTLQQILLQRASTGGETISLQKAFQIVNHEVVYQGKKYDHDQMIKCGWKFDFWDNNKVIDPFDGSRLPAPIYHSYYVGLTFKNISSTTHLLDAIYVRDSRETKDPSGLRKIEEPFECWHYNRIPIPPEHSGYLWNIFKVKGPNFFDMQFYIVYDGGVRQECQTLRQQGRFFKKYVLT